MTTNKRMRGKGKKPTLQHVTIRIPKDVYDWFYQHPAPTKLIREALTQYVNQANEERDNENISQN